MRVPQGHLILMQQFLFVIYKYYSAYYHFALLLYFVLFSNLCILLQAAQDQTRGEHDVVARAKS